MKTRAKKRDLLKALTLTGGAFVANQSSSLWTKPLVESVTLPAHAATSSCSPSGVTTFNDTSLTCEEDNPDIAIVFDCVRCQVIAGCFPGSTAASDVPDALVILDVDTDAVGWEWEDTGSNWEVIENDFPSGMDVDYMADGTYTLSATRPECRATVTFRVSTVNFPNPTIPAGTEVAVDQVSIVSIDVA